MKTKLLMMVIFLTLTACNDDKECINCGSTSDKTNPTPTPSIPEVSGSKIQMVRLVKAKYDFDGKIMTIDNLGWCEATSDELVRSGDECDTLNDYSKIQFEGKTTYLYKTLNGAKPFLPKPTMAWVSAKKSSDSSKWSKALKNYENLAVNFEIERVLSLKDWKYQNEILHKLQTSRCKSSKYNEVLKANKPARMGNRLLNTDNVFYFDTVLNLVSLIEVNLESSRIVGFPVIRDSHKSNHESDWNDAEMLKGTNNEVTLYAGDIVDDVNPLKRVDMTGFVVNCGIYYNSLNTKIKTYSQPSLAFFPTYNSKYDQEISAEVDRVLEMMSKATQATATDYRRIMKRDEIDMFIPSIDQISEEAQKFLLNDGYDVFTKKEFQKRSL